MRHPHRLPTSRHFPDPQHFADLARLGEEITELAAHIHAATFQLLELIRIFDEEQGWAGEGVNSCAHWLSWQCGMNQGTAREKVRVAHALADLPKISASFSEGRVSYSKVRAMTRVATRSNEELLLHIARNGTAGHVERLVMYYRRVKRLEALQQENRAHALRELSWYIDDDGMWVLKGRLNAEQGALISKVLEGVMEELDAEQRYEPDDVSAETPEGVDLCEAQPYPVAVRRADALERIAESYLAGGGGDRSGGDRYMVHVHTEPDTLKIDGEGAQSELEESGRVSAETSRRMACDSSVVHWRENAQGEPLSVGRKTRSIPPAIRRALKHRDGGCRFPGCSCSRFVDAHHIRHWADGGETSMQNLVLLCRRHHRLVHEGGFGVHSEKAGDIHFTYPDGRIMPYGPVGRFSGNVVELKNRNRLNGLEITNETLACRWTGEQMDFSLAVWGLQSRE